jgi:hypothetical protein
MASTNHQNEYSILKSPTFSARVLPCVLADWARALIPRSVTASTASHFARAIGAPVECTGLVVLLQASVTVAAGRLLLAAVGGSNGSNGGSNGSNGGSNGSNGGRLTAAAAGAAVGATAGVMGVAGVCGSEVAMANGAMAYACVVLLWSVLAATPGVAAALAALVA